MEKYQVIASEKTLLAAKWCDIWQEKRKNWKWVKNAETVDGLKFVEEKLVLNFCWQNNKLVDSTQPSKK